MSRSRTVAGLAMAVAVVVCACASGAPVASPAPSNVVTAAPPTADGGMTASPVPGGAVPGTVAVSASDDDAFDQATLSAPADVPLTFRFTNADPTFPHNVAVRGATPNGDFVGLPIAQVGTTVDYAAPAMAAGTYEFYCTVHPAMVGSLTVD